jgi:hypothetical protein
MEVERERQVGSKAPTDEHEQRHDPKRELQCGAERCPERHVHAPAVRDRHCSVALGGIAHEWKEDERDKGRRDAELGRRPLDGLDVILIRVPEELATAQRDPRRRQRREADRRDQTELWPATR